MSQTPRKFSEKIAILQRKSKVEVDEFTQIMQDVKKITTGRSPQTTPSSTPYPCSPTGGPGSSSTIQTPSATESPIGLMPDGYNLGAGGYVMHPLSGTYQRSGGSLPNVHQVHSLWTPFIWGRTTLIATLSDGATEARNASDAHQPQRAVDVLADRADQRRRSEHCASPGMFSCLTIHFQNKIPKLLNELKYI
jgi:hypothetical protein